MIKHATTILFIAAATLAFGSAANAQNGADQQQTQQIQQEYRQKASKLQEIHQETIKANPKLAAQQQEFEDQVRQAVEDQGYDVDEGQQRVQEMAQKLQSGDLSDSERKSTMQEFQAERQQMVQARNAAMQDPEIQQAGEELQQNTMAAMKRQDSQTEELLNDMKTLRSKLRSSAPAPNQQGSGNG